MTKQSHPIPVIDLFAGPGGLGEGFSSLTDQNGINRFSLRVSIEKDKVAHRTLLLRALFRAFPKGRVPDCYYDYVRGTITRDELFNHPEAREKSLFAASEAKCAELGVNPPEEIDRWINNALAGASEWVLIGGPPCQAYSVAGRARRRNKDPIGFESDKRHFLYTEYLRIIRQFAPSVFVMENVKGILTSTHGGSLIFERILSDLASPREGLSYKIRSFVVDGEGDDLEPRDFVIQAERFGVPQARHRVILLGVRSDVASNTHSVLKPVLEPIGVGATISGLPRLRSRLSRRINHEPDSREAWLSVVKGSLCTLMGWKHRNRMEIEQLMSAHFHESEALSSYGAPFMRANINFDPGMPAELRDWLHDPRLEGVLQHEVRSHMPSDLHRYMFAACYAEHHGTSPKLADFPPGLLPNHGNVLADAVPFVDRFRVQVAGSPSSTVVAHISKDGHYYIHPDPSQCRSLTVREAARLQTFPDNYFFEGNRTEQYTQIGNAVPPFLAHRIAEVVSAFLWQVRRTPESPRQHLAQLSTVSED